MVEQVKEGTYQLFDGDENTRHGMNLSFLKMGELSEHESSANLIDCTLISRFSARKGLVKSLYRRLLREQMTHVASKTSEAARNSRLQAIADHSLSVVDSLEADAASSGGEI